MQKFKSKMKSQCEVQSGVAHWLRCCTLDPRVMGSSPVGITMLAVVLASLDKALNLDCFSPHRTING